ncbi:AbrB/MazE/SpoVT family DNA-binding domain-containing protein [Paenibacillus sp.]|uniref:AbrB/MazE/SpoVT family DNA-binding domain-containing protein n=1 Tax=Paenibacillus sp. TaxID=58172 RepID=UPI002D666791|nr:AbrB/MazE/SpoVT family DNA-binding domain-containing protein [Paenibacillus sp.]HZG83865.1 AbrB/MazE/SpoVT family DNA-binding domain-containing protein [Paenibacillus sp.]
MKSTGVVRKVDELGRIVIPMELRRTLGIGEKDPLEVFVDGERIVLRKYAPGCVYCGSVDDGLKTLLDKLVCRKCTEQIAEQLTTSGNVKSK